MNALVRAYRWLAFITLNTLILLALLNASLALFFLAGGKIATNAGSLGYPDALLAQVYPGWRREDYTKMLRETWSRRQVCTAFNMFQERPYRGRYVNVHAAGFRQSGPTMQPYPLDVSAYNVFVFGGSTTFGYGVADDETMPAHLQELLEARFPDRPVHVYNFGQGYYFSSLELAQFTRLLRAGQIPDLAIFVDGLNEYMFYTPPRSQRPDVSVDVFDWQELGSPEGIPRADDCAGAGQGMANSPAGAWELPMKRAGRELRQRLRSRRAAAPADGADGIPIALDDPEILDGIWRRWMANRTMARGLAGQYDAATLFVWQPVPWHRYDRSHHLFSYDLGETGVWQMGSYGYAAVADQRESWEGWDDFLYLADIQADRAEPLYVDAVHYTSSFNRAIAQEIASRAAKRLGAGR